MLINLTLRQIQAFVAVAQNESYIKASRAIGLSQPAVTGSVRQLEESLGVRLLDRTTRSVRLTNEGRGFLATAERVLGDLSAAVSDIRSVSEKRRGRIVVACLPSVAVRLVGSLMRQFAVHYPGLVNKLYDGDAHEVENRVRSQEADFGVSSYPHDQPDLSFVPLVRDRFCVALPKGHALDKRKSIRFRELAAYPFVALAPTSGMRQIVDQAAAKQGIRLNLVCEAKQISTLTGMIKAGIGISVIPEVFSRNTGPAGLVLKRLVEPLVERDLGLILRRGRALSPAAESFRDAVVAHMPRKWADFATAFY